MKVMLDTNVFNHLQEGKIDKNSIPSNWEIYGTYVQKQEIDKTDQDILDPSKLERLKIKKEAMLSMFREFVESVPTETGAIGISPIGEAKIPKDDLCKRIKASLDDIKKRDNNLQDALIADTCIKNGFILITHDGPLTEVASSYGCKTDDLMAASEFL
jgi:hypothetical protein